MILNLIIIKIIKIIKKNILFKKNFESKFKELSNHGYKICIARLFTFYGEHIDTKEALPDLIFKD